MSMPKHLVVGNLPKFSLPTGHKVQAVRNSDEDIETLVRDFDALIISAVGKTTDHHGFLCRVGEYNEAQTGKGCKAIPLLVHHASETTTLKVDGAPRTWFIRQSLYNFGNVDAGDAMFVNTSTKGWEQEITTWLKNRPRQTRRTSCAA
jgi:hypothetical protein